MGENAPLKDCVIFFCATKVKCVQKSYHSFSDNDVNYKQSMKNVQSFHVIRYLTKLNLYQGDVLPHLWGKMPLSLTKQFSLNIYSKIRVKAVLA